MSLRREAIQGVFWSGLQTCGSNLILTVVLLVLAHYLPARAFGLIALAAAFAAFMQIVQRQGFGAAIVQSPDIEPLHLDSVFWTGMGMGTLLTAGGILGADLVARLFREPDLAPIVRWFSLSFVIAALGQTQHAVLMRRLAFKQLALRTMLAALSGGVVGIVMAMSGYGVWSLVGQTLTSTCVGTLVLWGACDWRPRFMFSVPHLKKLWSFGAYAMGINLVEFFGTRSDTLLIGYFLGSELLGYYYLAFRFLAALLQTLSQTVSSVALPTFSRLQHQSDQMRQAFYTATQMTGVVAIPAFVGLAVVARQLVPVLFGPEWNPSIPVVEALAMFGLVKVLVHFSDPVIMARGKASWQFGLSTLNAVVQVIAIVIAVHWGIVAVACASVLRIVLTAPVALVLVHRLIRLDVVHYIRTLAAPLAASVPMCGAVLATRFLLAGHIGDTGLVVVCVGVGVGVYALLILMVARSIARQSWEFLRLALNRGVEQA